MASDPPVIGSGDGTRPTTDGGVDNIGAGEKFTTKRNAEGAEIQGGPAPDERMRDRRRDVESSAKDDVAPLDLHEDLRPESNTGPPVRPEDGGKH